MLVKADFRRIEEIAGEVELDQVYCGEPNPADTAEGPILGYLELLKTPRRILLLGRVCRHLCLNRAILVLGRKSELCAALG